MAGPTAYGTLRVLKQNIDTRFFLGRVCIWGHFVYGFNPVAQGCIGFQVVHGGTGKEIHSWYGYGDLGMGMEIHNEYFLGL